MLGHPIIDIALVLLFCWNCDILQLLSRSETEKLITLKYSEEHLKGVTYYPFRVSQLPRQGRIQRVASAREQIYRKANFSNRKKRIVQETELYIQIAGLQHYQ